MKKQKVYTPGMGDVERVEEHLANEHARARKAEWLKNFYSKQKQKGDTNANHDES